MFIINGGNVPLPIPYTSLRMYQYIRVVKISKLLQVKIMSGSRVPLSDFLLTPYPDSHGGRLFGQKYNHKNLITRDSGNTNSPTVKPLNIRGSHKTSFHTYNVLTFRKLHASQIHLPRYWQ